MTKKNPKNLIFTWSSDDPNANTAAENEVFQGEGAQRSHQVPR